MSTYESGDAASAHGGLEVALQLLLDGAGGVKALGQEDDGVDEEEGGDAVDDVLKDLDTEHAQEETKCYKTAAKPARNLSLTG